ncbi:MAG: hypothetical protein HC888_07835 [Candidatus Competibacteraceae bacterium]|nr:hypothetical protein [Candidatus Competibacteraceae bacterium]
MQRNKFGLHFIQPMHLKSTCYQMIRVRLWSVLANDIVTDPAVFRQQPTCATRLQRSTPPRKA